MSAGAARLVGVIGSGEPDGRRDDLAESLGRAVASAGYGIVCGGLGGVMEAACRGAASVERGRGPIVGILPGARAEDANPWVEVVVPTGLGIARNLLVVLTGSALIAVGGSSGTLSEIAHGWQLGRPIGALSAGGGWAAEMAGRAVDERRDDRVEPLASVDEAVQWLRRVL